MPSQKCRLTSRTRTRFGALAVLLLTAAACDSADRPVSPSASETPLALAVARNGANARATETLRAEIEPHLRFAWNGTWTLDPAAVLSDAGSTFVALSRSNMTEITLSQPGQYRASSALSGAQNGIVCYWWGCSFAVSHASIQALSGTWRLAGGGSAVTSFLAGVGATGWAATTVPFIFPAYFLLMQWVDGQGGNRGVDVNVTWALVTVVTSH